MTPSGYAAALLQSVLALLAVSILAFVVLRWAAGRRGWPGAGAGRVRVLERVPLEARRSLYLVQIGERVLLLGAGEGGGMALLAELEPEELPELPETAGWGEVLARLRPGSAPEAPPPPPST